ncbi:hypothetical protein [Flexivirga oryzae]|uniref:Putative copper export protein n=1 Tax=Flexivirga oryzae TaxID=1794944 RepID=A0A839N372_9MICO|nr:hypothetical protein [Flexivirga oryzae]MBB2890086.1 putative copper export protein [Flexivirga oryzae]
MNIDWAEMATGTAKVIVAGLIFGAGLPLLYTMGIRLWDTGDEDPQADGTAVVGRQFSRWTAYAIFAVVLAAVIIGVLYITQKSIDHYLGIELF